MTEQSDYRERIRFFRERLDPTSADQREIKILHAEVEELQAKLAEKEEDLHCALMSRDEFRLESKTRGCALEARVAELEAAIRSFFRAEWGLDPVNPGEARDNLENVGRRATRDREDTP